MKNLTRQLIKRLGKSLLEAKEAQVSLINISDSGLTKEDRAQIVKVWNALDIAGLALHELKQKYRIN